MFAFSFTSFYNSNVIPQFGWSRHHGGFGGLSPPSKARSTSKMKYE